MPRARRLDSLTEREQAVLALLRRGLTNEEIASTLDITVAGAKYHVSQILGKLGVASREEAAQWQPPEPRSWWRGIVALSLAAKLAGATGVLTAVIGVGALALGVAYSGSGANAVTDLGSGAFDGVTAEQLKQVQNMWITDLNPSDAPQISLDEAEAQYKRQRYLSIDAAQLVQLQTESTNLCECPIQTLPPSPISPTPTLPPTPTPLIRTYLAWAIRIDTSQAFELRDSSGGYGWAHQGEVPWAIAFVNADNNTVITHYYAETQPPVPTPFQLLQFVPQKEVDGSTNSYRLTPAPTDYTVPIRALVADQTAQAEAPGATIVQTLLVQYTDLVSASGVPRLAWAVNFDPATVGPILPRGCMTACPRADQLRSDWFYTLIDANTGGFIHSEGSTSVVTDTPTSAPSSP